MDNERHIIAEFQEEYRFLSNFWSVVVHFEGRKYPSVENAYQAAKTIITSERHKFQMSTPGQAKRLGKKITLRADWDSVKLGIMRELIIEKFKHVDLNEMLMATGETTLIEGNRWHDNFWGDCKCCGIGQNHLGEILMSVRGGFKYLQEFFNEESENETN